jgi:hypothetical protein
MKLEIIFRPAGHRKEWRYLLREAGPRKGHFAIHGWIEKCFNCA